MSRERVRRCGNVDTLCVGNLLLGFARGRWRVTSLTAASSRARAGHRTIGGSTFRRAGSQGGRGERPGRGGPAKKVRGKTNKLSGGVVTTEATT